MVGTDAPGENFNFKPSKMAKNGFPRITPLSQDLLHFVDLINNGGWHLTKLKDTRVWDKQKTI